MVNYALWDALHCHAENARSIILHEMINCLLHMNPVDGYWLKRLRG